MGTGKTAVGQELAKIKKWQFVDLDKLIELKEKRRILEIFAKEGEPYFRRREQEILKEVSKEKQFVVACGGGIVINQANIKIMKDTGVIICLTAPAEVILKRTRGYSHRPLLNVREPGKQIELLLKLRAPYYAQADKTIDTSRSSCKEVVDKILKIIRSKRGFTPLETIRKQGKAKMSLTGFTLSELLLASGIMAFVLTALLSLFISSAFLGTADLNSNIAYDALQTKMEEVKNTSFASLDSLNGTFDLADMSAATSTGRIVVTDEIPNTLKRVRIIACFMCSNRLIGDNLANCQSSPVELVTFIAK